MNMNPPSRVLTLDVEDWDHANYASLQGRELEIQSSVKDRRYAMDSNIDLWIELLGKHQAKSTCFVLGEFAQRFPDAVRRLAKAGHEIASHGHEHLLIYEMNQLKFREFLKRGLGIVGDLVGTRPKGFRAPSWSVDERTPWFCEELALQGIVYDSSLFPVKTPLYGQKGTELKPYWVSSIFRIPVTVLVYGSLTIPFASGAFFRLSPLSLIRYGLNRAEKKNYPVMLVLHPRELDPMHPKLPIGGWQKSIHYANLNSTVPKLETLLSEKKWTSVLECYGSEILQSKKEAV